MPITTTCPGCKALFRLPEELAGKQVRCQKCTQLFTEPMPIAATLVPATVVHGSPVGEPIMATISEPPAATDEPILATVIDDAVPKGEPIQASVAEASEKKDTEARPPEQNAPPPERPMSVAMILSMMFLFIAAMLGTGRLAVVWVAGHLSPPLPLTVVPPLHATINGGFQGNANQDFRGNFDKGEPKMWIEPPRKAVPKMILIPVGGVDKRALTANDPMDPTGAGPYKLYPVHLEEGRSYVINMTSDAFTTKLSLFGPENRRILIGIFRRGNNSQITYRPAVTGTYTIHAASINDQRGPYVLTIEQQP